MRTHLLYRPADGHRLEHALIARPVCALGPISSWPYLLSLIWKKGVSIRPRPLAAVAAEANAVATAAAAAAAAGEAAAASAATASAIGFNAQLSAGWLMRQNVECVCVKLSVNDFSPISRKAEKTRTILCVLSCARDAILPPVLHSSCVRNTLSVSKSWI